MTSLDEKRAQRARQGSRRQRDVEALSGTGFTTAAYAAEHFPEETVGIEAAVHRAYIANGRKSPAPEQVRAIMDAKGWSLALRREAA